MQFRIDKKRGNDLSILGFGCMRFPSKAMGIIDERATEKLILEALELGVNYFDTAYLYPGSEEALGRIMARNNIRSRMLLATKLPHVSCHSLQDLSKYLNTSLKRLQVDYVDYYMVHNISTLSQWQRLLSMGIERWIKDQKDQGLVRSFGFSFHGSLDEFKRLIDAYDWDFCQIQYNYANKHYQAGIEGLRYASDKGLPVFIMEPLLGGKLANNLPKKAQSLFAERYNVGLVPSSVRGALRWIWNQPEPTMILSGMNQMQQLAENVETANSACPGMLSNEELHMYDDVLSIFQESYRIQCTGCNYCMPCPQGIDIPSLFSAFNTSYSTTWFSGVFSYFMSCGAHSPEPHYPSECIDCGKCLRHCPQSIQIPDELKRVRRRLQPPLSKQAMALFSKIKV